jgi:ABC-type amino acid transport system permease subunit
MCGDTLSTDPVKRLIYNITIALFAYITPLLTIFYSYFRILYVLHKRSDSRTFRFVKSSVSTNNYDNIQSNIPSRSSTKNFNHERQSNAGQSVVQEEINSHNMKTITRAKLKTLKLTVLIGKKKLI